MRQATCPGPSGIPVDYGELAWRQSTLDHALQSLPQTGTVFTDALNRADQLIQQAAVLFSQLVMFNHIRQLPHISRIEQLGTSDSWHTVHSSCFTFDPVRLYEIIGFDYPYPQGVMLVEGTTQQFGPLHGSLAVRGHILSESRELAATATPMLATWPDPQIPQW